MTSLHDEDLDLCPRMLDKKVPFAQSILFKPTSSVMDLNRPSKVERILLLLLRIRCQLDRFNRKLELATACWDPQGEDPVSLEIGDFLTHRPENVGSTYNAEEIDWLQSTTKGLSTHIQKLRRDDSSSSPSMHPSDSPITTEAFVHQEPMDAPSQTPNQTPKPYSSSNVSRPSME